MADSRRMDYGLTSQDSRRSMSGEEEFGFESRRSHDASPITSADVGVEVMNELVRSYGAKYTENGWEWSFENIQNAWEEHPYWTAIDYATLLVPGAKWGTAAIQVGKGAGLAGKAYKRGKLGYAAAVKASLELPKASGKGFAGKANLLLEGRGKRVDPRLLAKKDGSFDEKMWHSLSETERVPLVRHEAQTLMNEAVGSVGKYQLHSQNLARHLNRLGKDEQELVYKAMATKADAGGGMAMLSGLSPETQKIAKSAMGIRDKVHDEMFREGLISIGTWKKNKGRYVPQMYEELMEGADPMARNVLGGKGSLQGGKMGGMDPLKKRVFDSENIQDVIDEAAEAGLTLSQDPGKALTKIGESTSAIAQRRYVKSLSKSHLVKSKAEIQAALEAGVLGADEASLWMSSKLGHVIPGFALGRVASSTGVRKAKGIADRASRQKKRIEKAIEKGKAHKEFGTLDEMQAEASRLGQLEIDAQGKLFEARAKAAQGVHYSHKDKGFFQDKYVDPMILDDIDGMFAVNNYTDNVVFQHLAGLNQMFKVSKTAYNPATHSRNFLANVVFHNLATGTVPKPPVRGITEMRKFLLGHGDDVIVKGKKQKLLAEEAMEEGLLGHTLDRELMTDLMEIYGDAEKAENFGMFGVRRIPGLQRLANKSKRVYGYEDDVWKLDAYGILKDKFLKAGVSEELAKKRAVHEVTKYFPMYNSTNNLTKMIRQHVPFASFSMEAFRNWSSAMTYKPHLVLAWTHSAEMLTQMSALGSGVSEEEMEAAQKAMPGYVKGKKMMLLPWRDDEGILQYLDMSYILPLADMPAEAEKMNGALFGVPPELNPFAGFGLTSNPLISTAIAATTGKDVFTGREVEGRFAKQQLGITPPNQATDRFFGLVEHVANSLTSPIAPWGFAGMNIIENVRGTVDPQTRTPMEPDVIRTMATNLFGFRMYAPDEKGARNKIRFERDELNKQKTWLKKQYKFRLAQGDKDGATDILMRLQEVYVGEGKDPSEALASLKRSASSRGGLSRREERQAARDAERVGAHPIFEDVRQQNIRDTAEIGRNARSRK